MDAIDNTIDDTIVDYDETDNRLDKITNASINIELSDIIKILAPSNPAIHEQTYIISYIDQDNIKLVNIATFNEQILNLTDGQLSDESILEIQLLSRSDVKGYALQHNLIPDTWINIYFGGDMPTIINGEITALDEDMIEITTFPEREVIYIDFEYKGLPVHLPIDKIVISNKPATISDEHLIGKEEGEVEGELASQEWTDDGESVINIPETAKVDANIRQTLHDMYIQANDIVFGEAEVYEQAVEIPENEKRYTIDAQVNDLMDELLSTIPNYQRTVSVLDNIHLLIERFKELRQTFSRFDEHGNAHSKMVGATYKPIVNQLYNLSTKFKWIMPVITCRRKLYALAFDDAISADLTADLTELETAQLDYSKNRQDYATLLKNMNSNMTPFDKNEQSVLHTGEIQTDLDAIISNFDDFYSTVYAGVGAARRRFIIQKYNMSLTKLEKDGNRLVREPVQRNDTMQINGWVTLPEPVVRFSQVYLPATNILTRCLYGQNYLYLFKLLNSKTASKQLIIDDLDTELNYDDFLSNITEYLLNENLYEDDDYYRKFLNAIIPRTRNLIRMTRKYITDKLSVVEIINTLQPFGIYTWDISFKQHDEIRYFIKEKLKEYKSAFDAKAKDFSILQNIHYKVRALPLSIDNILLNSKMTEFFKTDYNIKDLHLTSSEMLSAMLNKDSCNLFVNLINHLFISLNTSNIVNIFDEPAIDDTTKIKNECGRLFITKRYTSLINLQKDNTEDVIFYDKEFDNTPYDILDKYKDSQKKMSPADFIEFLAENLIQKHDCPRTNATELAETLISKKKRINQGEYAILELRPTSPDDLSESELKHVAIESDMRMKLHYYRRKNNVWVRDSTVNEESFIDSNTLFCNINPKCVKNQKLQLCEPALTAEERIKQIAKSKMKNEFNRRLEVSIDEFGGYYKYMIEYCGSVLSSTEFFNEIQRNKANNLAYEIGKLASILTDAESPYIKLRDAILAQPDFVKKQSDICQFADDFCREPMIDQLDEDSHWMYCKETNTKLLPFSLKILAFAFTVEHNYQEAQDQLCRTHGVLSDDGDAIVDKYSGYELRKIDFVTEEGYDEAGFKVISNGIIEKDLGAVIIELLNKKDKVFENETTQMIYNIFYTIVTNIGIPPESLEDIVLRTSQEQIIKSVRSEASYQKIIDAKKKENAKTIETYAAYRNQTIIYIVAAVIIVAIQTATPSFKTNRTFPGCIRSFSGYPLDGIEDLTGIAYIACVVYKIKTDSKFEPWTSLKRYTADILTSRIKIVVEKNIMSHSEIVELYTKKREYVLLHPDTSVPAEHNIEKWRHFMPPVVQFGIIKSLQNVSVEFKNDLLKTMRDGRHSQHQDINTVRSKMVQYSYGIIELINTVIKDKDLYLKTAAKIPFLENACCSGIVNPVRYFINEDESVKQYIDIIASLSSFIYDVAQISKAPLFYHPEFTGFIYPPAPNVHFDDNIYGAFIHYCNFDNAVPIPTELKQICTEKPEYNKDNSLEEKIVFLKKNGKNYKAADLNRLMSIINQNNIVPYEYSRKINPISAFNDFFDYLDRIDSTIIEIPLRSLLSRVVNNYNEKVMIMEDSKEIYELKNYLMIANGRMFADIMQFFDAFGSLNRVSYNRLLEFMQHITTWKGDLHTVSKFMQNTIYSCCKVYPQIILNNKSFDTIHKHWGLSDFHERDLYNFIQSYYESLKKFNGDADIARLILEMDVKLADLNTLVHILPIFSPIYKGDVQFYSLFDKDCVYLLLTYIWYSVIYEYISVSDMEAIVGRPAKPDIIIGAIDVNEADAEMAQDMNEMQLAGRTEEFKTKVCSLLLTYIGFGQGNKAKTDMTYSDIRVHITRSKEQEKKLITDFFRDMDPEERKVEDMKKSYKLGRWNVGMQKGLVKYDKQTYDREREQDEVQDEALDEVLDEVLDEAPEDDTPDDDMGFNMSELPEDYDDNYENEDDDDFGREK